MGIDIYMAWPGQTEEERQAQYTGFSICAGERGYLREAYHGPPYATPVLVPECWDDEAAVFNAKGERRPEDLQPSEDNDDYHQYHYAKIPVATLRKRLPAAIAATRERYGSEERFDTPDSPEINGRLVADVSAETYEAFVKLAEARQDADGCVYIHSSY